MAFGPAYGTSGAGIGAVEIFTKKDGDAAIFPNTSARDTYFNANPDELDKLKNLKRAVGIGTANQITAAYMYPEDKWVSVATNFKGEKGEQGTPGSGIDYSHLKNGQIPVWDASGKIFTNSGISSPEEGEIKMAPNSLTFGHHKMSSAVADVTFTNLDTNKHYSFVYQTMEPGDKDAYLREVDSNVEDKVRVPVGTADVTNPINTVTIDADEVFYSGTFILTNDTQDVVLEMFDATNPDEAIWRELVGDLPAGSNDIVFDTPFKCRKGFKYTLKLYSRAGDLVAKGSGTNFSWTIQRAKMYDKKIAKEEWVKSLPLIEDATLIGNAITFSLQNGTTKTVNLPANGGSAAAPYNFVHLDRDRVASVSEFKQSTPVYAFEGTTEVSLTIPATDVLTPGIDAAFIVSNRSASNAYVSVKTSGTDSINSTGTTSLSVPKSTSVLFVSDYVGALWYAIVLHSPTGAGQNLDEGKIVKNIEAQPNGKDLLVQYYDDSNITITLDGWSADLAKLNEAIENLERYTKNKTRFFVYKGGVAPTFQRKARGGYYLTFYGQTANINMVTPDTSSKLADGTILFIDNNSKDYYINVAVNAGETIDGKATTVIPPETTAWYVRNDMDWQELYSGFLPSSHRDLIAEIKTLITADNSFMRSLTVQSDDPTQTAVAATSLEFEDFDVSTPADDTTKGIIKFKGTTFENPDGSKITTNIIKLVGMEVSDPGDGTPPKLMLTGGNLPTPHPTGAYAFFDDAEAVPDNVDFSTLTKYTGGRVTLHKDTDDPKYAYILLPSSEGAGADRIGELGGLPAFWAKSSKTYTINGQSESFIVFRSPYQLKEQDVTLIIYH